MKNQYSIIMLVLILLGGVLKAQTNDWQPCSENPTDGTFGINGVRAYYQLSTCNNIETVLLKVENLNAYAVKVGWNDVAFTNDDKKLPLSSAQDSLTVLPNSSAIGECGGKNVQLAVKLSDFGTDKYNFLTFRVINFDFVLIH